MKTAQNMMNASKKRRAAKRKAIETEHSRNVKDIEVRVDKLFEKRKSRVMEMQRKQWDKLYVLNKKRQSLEEQILSSMKNIERHTLNMTIEMKAMFEGRLEDIRESVKEREQLA